MAIEGDAGARFRRFHRQEIAPYRPPERRHVEAGYADMDFPFAALPAPEAAILRDWDLAEFLGYVRTWSAVGAAERAGRKALVSAFENDMAALWGDPETCRRITWPIRMRIGRV